MMNRRAFLATLAAVPVAAVMPLSSAPAGLAFHPQAFEFAMAPVTVFNRYDVLWGWTCLQPSLGVRFITDEQVENGRLPIQRFDPARLPA